MLFWKKNALNGEDKLTLRKYKNTLCILAMEEAKNLKPAPQKLLCCDAFIELEKLLPRYQLPVHKYNFFRICVYGVSF